MDKDLSKKGGKLEKKSNRDEKTQVPILTRKLIGLSSSNVKSTKTSNPKKVLKACIQEMKKMEMAFIALYFIPDLRQIKSRGGARNARRL